MRMSSSLWASPAIALWLTVAAIIISIILFTANNITITNAQQQQEQFISQPAPTQNGTTLFQSIEDSFRVQVPEGWVIHDMNNTGSKLIEEATHGYGILAQLCPQEQLRQGLFNVSASISVSCQRSDEGIIHIIRYPNLDTRLQTAYGVTTNNMTTDNILLYHLQKLQEVGYRGIQIVNSTESAVNVTNAQTNQTIAKAPAKLVEMTYSTNFAPNETKTGYFILTATNATAPNPGMTKGYSIFYENTSVPAAAVQTTTLGSVGLAPTTRLPAAVGQVFDSFQLIAAAEVVVGQSAAAQTGQTVQTDCDPSYPDVCIPPPPPDLDCPQISERNFEVRSPDPHGFDGDNDGIGCDSRGGSNQPDEEGGGGGEQTDCDPSYPDVCIPPPPPDLNCDDISERNFEVRSPDPHGFDGDNDGIGCESGSNQSDDEEEQGGEGGGAEEGNGGNGNGEGGGGGAEEQPEGGDDGNGGAEEGGNGGNGNGEGGGAEEGGEGEEGNGGNGGESGEGGGGGAEEQPEGGQGEQGGGTST